MAMRRVGVNFEGSKHFLKIMMGGGIAACSVAVSPYVMAETSTTVSGTLNGASITRQTTFNTVIVESNQKATVTDKAGNLYTVTNTNSVWNNIGGSQDLDDYSFAYEPIGANTVLIKAGTGTEITTNTIVGGLSLYDGDPSIRAYSVMNNLIRIGDGQENGGVLRASVITGGQTEHSPKSLAKSYPYYNVVEIQGMTVTGQGDGRVSIYGGMIGVPNYQLLQGNSFSNVVNIGGNSVLQKADVYGAFSNVVKWGGHVSGNHINISGNANLSDDVTLHGTEIKSNGVGDRRRRDNIDNNLNIGYEEVIITNPSGELPTHTDLYFENINTFKQYVRLPEMPNDYMKREGRVNPWLHNTVKAVSDFSSIKIWAMNDSHTPALRITDTGNFTFKPQGTLDSVGTIIDLSYLTSGVDYGDNYYQADGEAYDLRGRAASPNIVDSFKAKVKDIDLRTMTDEAKTKIFFRDVAPDTSIMVIESANSTFSEDAKSRLVYNKLTYGYDVTQNGNTLTGYYEGTAAIDENNVVWRTGDVSVTEVKLGQVAIHKDGTQSSPLVLDSKYGYAFSSESSLAINSLAVINPTNELLLPNQMWTLIDGSKAQSVTGLDVLADQTKEYMYDMAGGAVTVKGTGTTSVIDSNKKLALSVGTPEELNYRVLDWAAKKPIVTIPTSGAFDLSGTRLDWSQLQHANMQVLRAGLNKAVLLDAGSQDFGLREKSLVGSEQTLVVGSTLIGTGRALLENGNVVYTADMQLQPQTHNAVLGQTAVLAALLDTNDLIIDTMRNVEQSTDGTEPFVTVGGGRNRYDTGSHITTNMWRSQVGLSVKRTIESGHTLTYGPFFEYGTGSYRIYDNTRGDGSIDYKGGGFFVKESKSNGIYAEASVRIGRAANTADQLLRSETGAVYSYGTNSLYHGFHVGVGREVNFQSGNSYDWYMRFFQSHLNEASFKAGGEYDIDGMTSSILRIGSRFGHTVANTKYFAGLAYEYEFDGEAFGWADGGRIRSASLRGVVIH